MPLQNRVTPFGEIIDVSARGTLMGNRGCLHDAEKNILRAYQGKRWISCRLDFRGRRQVLMAPGHYTQLFFLDEATALAAGHRPCAECQRERYGLFRSAWASGNSGRVPSMQPTADEIDAALQAERITRQGAKLTYPAEVDELPEGCMVRLAGDPSAHLVYGQRLLRWSPEGYYAATPGPVLHQVEVLTPRSIVRALANGYSAKLHATAYACSPSCHEA